MFEKHEAKMATRSEAYKIYNSDGVVVKEGVLTHTINNKVVRDVKLEASLTINDPDKKSSEEKVFKHEELINIGDIKSIDDAIENMAEWVIETINSEL